jgi:CMP-N-acetylneuraminic acid synthetase
MITAIIPVRKGSVRIKDKNIQKFGDSNLLIRKIRQLQKSNVDKIVVSSDSEEYLEMAKQEGADIHKRDLKYSDDKSVPFGEVVKKICEEVEGDIIIWSPCVCPFMDEVNYNTAIELFKHIENEGYDSLISVRKFKEFLWNDKEPINYELGKGHVISQNLPDLYVLTNGIYMAKRKTMVELAYFIGKKPFLYEVGKKQAVDIDDQDDLDMARALLS